MLDKMADFDERLARMEERHQGELRVQHEQVRHSKWGTHRHIHIST